MPPAPSRHQHAVDGLRLVVNQRLTVEPGDCPAGFVHQKIGSRKVPVVAGTAGDGAVQLAGRNPRDAQRERVNPGHGNQPGMALREPFQDALGAAELGAIEIGSIARRYRLVVAGGAAARGRHEHLVCDRREQRSDRGTALFDQGRRDRPIFAFRDKSARAVDRIDHPHPPRADPCRVVLAFLRQPAVAGPEQMGMQDIVRRDVRFGDRRVALALGPFLERAFVELERNRARLLHRHGEPRGIVLARFLAGW